MKIFSLILQTLGLLSMMFGIVTLLTLVELLTQ